jgi:hypothetical protein
MSEHPAQTTIVSFLLDRTGSMDAIKNETIGGFNAYLDALERDAGDVVEFTMLQFDSISTDRLYLGAMLSDVQRLTPTTYQPRAYTPLIDACMKTIKTTEELVARRRDKPRVIVVFQTDGEENASQEYTLAELRDLIARRQAEDWLFVFLGADIDAYAAARSFGISEDSTVAYSGKRSLNTMITLAEESGRFASRRSQRVGFSAAQKRAAGDRYGAAGGEPDDTRAADA